MSCILNTFLLYAPTFLILTALEWKQGEKEFIANKIDFLVFVQSRFVELWKIIKKLYDYLYILCNMMHQQLCLQFVN